MAKDPRCSDHKSWTSIAKTYEPIKIGSIDGTDSLPHDRGIVRALDSEYRPSKNIKGKPHRTLIVARLDRRTSQEIIEEKFGKFGKIVSCRLICDIVTGLSKGYAFVAYDSSKSAEKAYEQMHRQLIDGAKILVDYEMERKMPGWKPRRLGGGFGGKKEAGQLRFGCRERPFQRPIVVNVKHRDSRRDDQYRDDRHRKR